MERQTGARPHVQSRQSSWKAPQARQLDSTQGVVPRQPRCARLGRRDGDDKRLFRLANALRGPLLLQEDLLVFVWAFALSGAVCGVASVAIYGRTRRAFWLLLAFIAILALSVALTRWEVTRLVGAGGPRFNHLWEWILSSLAFGLALGGSAGIIASGMVAVFAFLTRRTITWKSGLVLDVLLVALGFWLLPQAIPRLAEWTCGWFRWRYGSGEEALALAACTGAALGCLIGPVVLTLVTGAGASRVRTEV